MFGYSSLMEKVSRVRAKDCFKDGETIYFIVHPRMNGKALGKSGVNIKRIQTELDKKIKIIEFSPVVEEFVRKAIYPLKVEEVVKEENVVFLKDGNKKTKSLLIGRDGRNLQAINRAVKRFFDVEVKVV